MFRKILERFDDVQVPIIPTILVAGGLILATGLVNRHISISIHIS